MPVLNSTGFVVYEKFYINMKRTYTVRYRALNNRVYTWVHEVPAHAALFDPMAFFDMLCVSGAYVLFIQFETI